MPRDDDKLNRPSGNGGDEPLDFGEFVSSNVQRTSDLLKGGEQENPQQAPSQRPGRPGGERKVERAKDRSYWRRKAAGAGVAPGETEGELPPPPQQQGSRRNRYLPQDDEADQFHDENEFSDQGGGFGGMFADFFSGDGDDGNRNRIIAAIIGLVILILIIFGLTQIFSDGDSGDDGDATPVATETIDALSTPDGGPTDLTDGPETAPATEEPEIPRGGDNQRGDGGDIPDSTALAVEPTATAVEIELTSEIARACSGFCLVRMEGPDQQAALDEAEARVSWEDGAISWIVVTPQQAEILQRTHTLTLIETEPRTYNLYMVKTAEDHNQREVIAPHGTIIDEIGRYYLVRWNSVPAVVKPVTDWGYAVWKIAPAQPEVIAETQTNGPARETSGWALKEQVRPDNIERTVNELTQVGELDNSGLGTRYYTYPGNQIAADYLYQELESYGLEVRFEDFIMWDGYLLVNVVAEIPGNDDSEAYAVMAHFDTINNDNPRVAPGADDNASGIAVTLETARILAGYELEHPVQIAFVNAEEVGIVGAPAWARAQNADGVPIQGVFNVDSVGSVRNRPIVMTNAQGSSVWMQQHMSRINTEYELMETFQHNQSDNIVADDNFVRAEGIPAVMVARELYGASDYHHTSQDVVANLSSGGIIDTTYLIVISVWDLVKE